MTGSLVLILKHDECEERVTVFSVEEKNIMLVDTHVQESLYWAQSFKAPMCLTCN